MSTLSQFMGGGGGVVPAGLKNGESVFAEPSGATFGDYALMFAAAGCRRVVTGSVTANTLATVLSLSGKGVVNHISCGSVTTSGRTHRLKVTLDGIVIFDGSKALGGVASPICAVGGLYSWADTSIGLYTLTPTMVDYCFEKSLLIEYASSLTESAQTAIFYRYTPRA